MVGTLRRLLAVPLIFLIGCGSGAPTSRGAEAPAQPQAPAGPKRLVLGLGPYRLKEWVRGSHLVFAAFDAYALGRPKIDEIEVRFIPDPNTMMANMLSGALEMPQGSIVGMDQALTMKEQWLGGQVVMDPSGWVVAYPQSIDPQPRILLDPQFRRALLHAVDRQQMVDALMLGLLPVAHSVFW